MSRIRKGDIVRIRKPRFPPKERFRGTQGKVLEVLPSEGRVVVEGMNLVWKHVRPGPRHPKGGRIQVEAPIRTENVMLVCQQCGKPTRPRAGWIERPDTKKRSRRKIRICRRCGKPVRPEE